MLRQSKQELQAAGVHAEHETAGSRKESSKGVTVDKRTSQARPGFIKSRPSEVLLDHRLSHLSDCDSLHDTPIQPG